MNPIKYPVAKPNLDGNEKKYLCDAIQKGEISHKGGYVKVFEEQFAQYIGTKYALTCSSGTASLHLSLAALRIGPGDEVLVPEMTMIATAWAVKYTGAKPVFVDCDEKMLINPNDILKKITPKTKAIIPVHLYGRVCDMGRIMEIAHEYNLFVIEDCAEAHGAQYLDLVAVNSPKHIDMCLQKVGSIGQIGCFSLFGNKIISSGEGGILTTNDEKTYKQLEHLRGMAFDSKHTFCHPKIGFNYRMSNLQGAVALAQLERMEEFLEKRKLIQQWYWENLDGNKIQMIERNVDYGDVLWMFDIITPKPAQEMINELSEHGIEARYLFCPMSYQPSLVENALDHSCYRPAASLLDHFYNYGLYLPTYFDLSEDDVKYICEKVNGLVNE